MVDSCWCMAEANTTWSDYPPSKNKLKKKRIKSRRIGKLQCKNGIKYIWHIYDNSYTFLFSNKKMSIFDVWAPTIKLNYNFKELFLKKKENYRKLKERHENTCLKLRSKWIFSTIHMFRILIDKKSQLIDFVSYFSSVQFSHSVESDSLRPHELQHARPPCPSPPPGVHPNSCPSSRWCHPAISSSVIPFSSCPQSLPASEFLIILILKNI